MADDVVRSPFGFATVDRSLTPERAIELLAEQYILLESIISTLVPSAALSASLKIQLAWMALGNPCVFDGIPRVFNQHAIIDEIAFLEGIKTGSTTKPDGPFTGKLQGFRHKHFFDAQFMAKNLRDEIEKNFYTLWHRDFVSSWEKHATLKGETRLDELGGLLTHVMVQGAFENRAGRFSETAKSRVTGEWIVFASHRGRKVYLTIGLHEESEEAIVQRICQCAWQFPFVISLLHSAGWTALSGPEPAKNASYDDLDQH
jgi:hypothetical protein